MSSRAKKKWKYRQHRLHEEVKNKLIYSGSISDSDVLLADEPRQEKMSTLLLDFIAPYSAAAESEEEFQIAIAMGLIAWNVALLPMNDRKEAVEQLTKSMFTDPAEFAEIIDEMVERKETYFADCRRWILGHELTMTRNGPHLSVVSTAD